jgi:hypothetical protein
VGSRVGAGQEELRRGSPRRSGDGGAEENGRHCGVQRRRDGFGGHRCAERGPAAPVREGEDGVSSNLGMVRLGGHSPERGKTAAVLGEIRCEGEGGSGHGSAMWRGTASWGLDFDERASDKEQLSL